tara:strand:- start:91 stop:366 length:276 start_codon:yes stop_codon:yes gene_type:complete
MNMDYKEIEDAKVVSICFEFNLNDFTQGNIKWIMFDSKDSAIDKQLKDELDEPTVLQHFNVKGKNDDGFILELQGGLEIKAVEVEQNAKDN